MTTQWHLYDTSCPEAYYITYRQINTNETHYKTNDKSTKINFALRIVRMFQIHYGEKGYLFYLDDDDYVVRFVRKTI